MMASGCTGAIGNRNSDSVQDCYSYNICLVLDGSDRLSNQNEVPQVSTEEIVGFAKSLAEKGRGSLYVSFVDNNCDNNKVAVFEWDMEKPSTLERKPGYMKASEYAEIEDANRQKHQEYSQALVNSIEYFSRDCSRITGMAYSDEVARQKNGSDVNGALNQAIRLLRAKEEQSDFSYIVLVSDGCDNVGKELTYFPQSTELLIVNSSVTQHPYGDIVSREFVTLKQALSYIFN